MNKEEENKENNDNSPIYFSTMPSVIDFNVMEKEGFFEIKKIKKIENIDFRNNCITESNLWKKKNALFLAVAVVSILTFATMKKKSSSITKV